MQQTDLEWAANIGFAVEDICCRLPKGWLVKIDLERGERRAGSVMLFDDRGDGKDFSAGNGSLSEELRDALQYARRAECLTP